MPCSAEEYQGGRENDRRWRNWLGNVDYVIPSFFQPSDRADLVWVLAQAEAEGKKVKAVGRGWSYEDCAVSEDWVVDLSRLDATIPFLTTEASGTQVLSPAWRERQFGDSAEKLYHVEAGIRIFDLNERLAGDGLSMLTLGGSQGQRLAGAISTSTHGSNLDQPPLPGVVLAIHLVTTGGREVWIESASDPLTADDAALIDQLGCADIEIIRDDELLRAARVTIGRFGVIYAYVLRVTQAYRLSEWTEEVSWSSVAGALTAGVGQADDVAVRAHLGGLAGLLTDPPGALDISSAPGEFHFLDILLNTNLRQRGGDDGCWIRRRWLTENVDDLGLEADDNPLCDNRVARSLLLVTGAALATYAGNIALIPIYGTAKAVAIGLDVTKLNALAHDPELTGGEALAAALEAVWRAQIGHELEGLVADLNQSVLGGMVGAGGDGKRGPSRNILAGLTEGTTGECYRANSVEIVFSTETSAYVDYVNQLLNDADEFRIGGYISLRFSQRSDAHLSMHSVSTPLAVSVEVTSLHGLDDSHRWVLHAERLGKQMGGRPHWGQQNELSSLEVAQLYGVERLHGWKDQCLRMVGMGSTTFSNAYTRQRGLEPTRFVRYVTHTMKRNGTVTHLCNPGEWWSPMPIADAIEHTASEVCTYATKPANGAPARLRLRRYLGAAANATHLDNLDRLPACGVAGIVLPPADRRRLRITAVVRSTSRWTVIRSVCNREENWHIPTLDAFHQIRAGTREFYVIDPVTGGEVPVVAHEYLSTNADADGQNNLGELPLLAA